MWSQKEEGRDKCVWVFGPHRSRKNKNDAFEKFCFQMRCWSALQEYFPRNSNNAGPFYSRALHPNNEQLKNVVSEERGKRVPQLAQKLKWCIRKILLPNAMLVRFTKKKVEKFFPATLIRHFQRLSLLEWVHSIACKSITYNLIATMIAYNSIACNDAIWGIFRGIWTEAIIYPMRWSDSFLSYLKNHCDRLVKLL